MIRVKTIEARRTVKIQSDKDILKKRNQHLHKRGQWRKLFCLKGYQIPKWIDSNLSFKFISSSVLSWRHVYRHSKLSILLARLSAKHFTCIFSFNYQNIPINVSLIEAENCHKAEARRWKQIWLIWNTLYRKGKRQVPCFTILSKHP